MLGRCPFCFHQVESETWDHDYYVYCPNGCFINEFVMVNHVPVSQGVVRRIE